jgi:flagella basal body P-ring formation protein FlgA
MKAFFLLLTIPVLSHAACLAVSSARILAGDLARAVPQFASLDPAAELAFSPLPGTERILSGHELVLLLRQHGIASTSARPIPDVCVQRFTRPILRADMQQALWSALDTAHAELDLIDFSSQPLPPGRLAFRREGLNRPPIAAPDAPVVWRGKLIYDGNSSIPVWAKARIFVNGTWFVAAENIRAGTVIRSGQVRTVTGRQFPDRAPSLLSSESIAGKVARRNIRSGERFAPDLIEFPLEVQKGQRVHVKVVEGLASLSLDAVAQSSGRKGDTIVVHNPSSGRNFRAVVQEKGAVAVEPGSVN